ncbi:MAG: hypothetical protein ABI912_02385 [Actinomycetota bacterium]
MTGTANAELGRSPVLIGAQPVSARDAAVSSRKSAVTFVSRERRSRWRERREQSPGGVDEILVSSLYTEHGAILLGYVTRLTGDRHAARFRQYLGRAPTGSVTVTTRPPPLATAGKRRALPEGVARYARRAASRVSGADVR